MTGPGLGLGFLAVALILALAVQDRISGVDLSMVGWICAAIGVVALIVSFAQTRQRANTSHHEVVERHDDINRRDIV